MEGLQKDFAEKKTGEIANCFSDRILFNVIRTAICMIVGILALAIGNSISDLRITAEAAQICFFSALTVVIFNVSWLFSVKNESYMFLCIFTMLGTVVNVITSSVVYNEALRINQCVGMIILVISAYIMSHYNSTVKGKITKAGMVWLSICGLSQGLSDFFQKMYMKEIGGSAAVFNFYTFAMGLVILIVLWGIFRIAERKTYNNTKRMSLKPAAIYATIIAVSLYINSYCKTLAAGILTAAQLYPVLQGLNLILSSLMAWILLKEKMNLKSIIGITIAFAALLIMNLL